MTAFFVVSFVRYLFLYAFFTVIMVNVIKYFILIYYVRTRSEHLAAERDKLRSDLNEASSRISLLVKEGDERNAALEKAKEKEVA